MSCTSIKEGDTMTELILLGGLVVLSFVAGYLFRKSSEEDI